jgi:hypothetical protein
VQARAEQIHEILRESNTQLVQPRQAAVQTDAQTANEIISIENAITDNKHGQLTGPSRASPESASPSTQSMTPVSTSEVNRHEAGGRHDVGLVGLQKRNAGAHKRKTRNGTCLP